MEIFIKEAVSKEEIATLNEIAGYSFNRSPDPQIIRKRIKNSLYREGSKQFLLYCNEKAAATLTIFPMTQNLRKIIVKMGGVATVACLPEFRRRGLIRKIVTHALEDMKNNGYAVSVLHPFQEGFYAKFGYVNLTRRVKISIPTDDLTKVINLGTRCDYERYNLHEGMDQFYEYLRSIQNQFPGMIIMPRKFMDRPELENYWILFAKLNDDIMGACLYRITDYGETLEVIQFHPKNHMGKLFLLYYFGLHIDQVKTVDIIVLPEMIDEFFIHDIELKAKYSKPAMARIIDIEAMNGLRTGMGELVIEIKDDLAPWNTGVFQFSSDGQLSITRSNLEPQVYCSIDAMTAFVYGHYDTTDLIYRNQLRGDTEYLDTLTTIFFKQKHHVSQYF